MRCLPSHARNVTDVGMYDREDRNTTHSVSNSITPWLPSAYIRSITGRYVEAYLRLLSA